MKNKRLLSGVCAFTMVMSLAACGGGASSATATTAAGETQAAAGQPAGEAAYTPEGNYNIRVFAAAGGIADTVTRITAQSLQEQYGVTPIINNITGASGAVAATDMDGYDPSIHEMSLVSMSLFTMSPLMNPDIKVSLDNYGIVGSLIRDEFVLLVSKDSGITSWEDLAAYGKDQPIIYASNTPGGFTHVVQTALFGDAGLDGQALTSDGSNKDILALMSGDAICASATASLAKNYVESGDVIPIMIFSENNYTGFEGYDVPSSVSLGFDITLPSYNFLITRAGVPQEELDGMYAAIKACRESDSFKTAAEAAAYDPDDTDGATLRAEIEAYAKDCEEIFNKYYK